MKRAIVIALAVGLGCGGLPIYEQPEERTGGVPLMEAPNPRTGEIAWRSGSLETHPDGGVRFEFTLMNGTPRDYVSVMLRVVLRGADRETATARYPVGSRAARLSRKKLKAAKCSLIMYCVRSRAGESKDPNPYRMSKA